MIIEFVWYEPEGGRVYEHGVGGSVPAIETRHIEVQECWYTKLKSEAGQLAIPAVASRFNAKPKPEVLPHADVSRLQWYEAIYVKYRFAGEAEHHSILGIGYLMHVYSIGDGGGARLDALLGPEVREMPTKEEDHEGQEPS